MTQGTDGPAPDPSTGRDRAQEAPNAAPETVSDPGSAPAAEAEAAPATEPEATTITAEEPPADADPNPEPHPDPVPDPEPAPSPQGAEPDEPDEPSARESEHEEEIAEEAPAPTRWDAPAGAQTAERDAAAAAGGDGNGGSSPLRLVALALLAGGALYAGLATVQQQTVEEPRATVRPPQVVEERSVSADAVPEPPVSVPAATWKLRDADALKLEGTGFRFVRLVRFAPAEVCRQLAEAGWTTSDWGPSPLGGINECLARRSFGKDGQADGFAVLREGDGLSELRIKLNLYDPGLRGEAARDVGTLVAGLFEAWHWDEGEALSARIAGLAPFDGDYRGTRVRFLREKGEVERWNLIMRFPTPPKPPEIDPALAAAPSLADLAAVSLDGEPAPPGDDPP